MPLSTYYSEYGRHVARLHRRHRRHAYAPTSNTAAHDNHEKISSWVSFFLYGYEAPLGGPSRRRSYAIKITDHFTCTSANVIYCITCTLCKKLYIGETGRRLGDRFREHLRDIEKDDKNASKPVARHLNLPNHSKQHMSVYGLSLHQGSTESRKTLKQKIIFQIGTLNPHGINERFSFN